MYDKELWLAKKLAIQAGNTIMKIYKTEFNFTTKDDNSPLTLADKKANEIIVKGLKENFMEYAILSEESKDDKNRLAKDYCFIVDPLDGTREFIKRNGQFAVNIALAYKHKVVVGVIYVPVTRDLYYASKGDGAYLEKVNNANSTADKKKLQASNRLMDLIIVGSKSHSSEKETNLIKEKRAKIKGTIFVGSSVKGCMVAEGKADAYYRFGLTSEWDTAAMQCIVEEAGGIFKQLDGTEMSYNRRNNLNEKGFYVVNRVENIWV